MDCHEFPSHERLSDPTERLPVSSVCACFINKIYCLTLALSALSFFFLSLSGSRWEGGHNGSEGASFADASRANVYGG